MQISGKQVNVLFSNYDLCALSNVEHERRYLDIFAKYKVPQVMSVVPFMTEDGHNFRNNRFHEISENSALVGLLKEHLSKGLIDIAQHGVTHQTNYLYPSRQMAGSPVRYEAMGGYSWLRYSPLYPEEGYSEFKGLQKEAIKAEINRGRECLRNVFQVPIETFTFPWGLADSTSLKVLKEEGFKVTLCGGKDRYLVKGLMIIYNPREDVFDFIKEFDKQQIKGPFLYHIVLHSWKFKENDFIELDRFLARLTSDKRVGFVTGESLTQWPKSFKLALRVDRKVRIWAGVANQYLTNPIQFPQRYDLNIATYWAGFFKSGLVRIIFEKVGLNRFWFFSGVFFILFIQVWLAWKEEIHLIDDGLMVFFGVLFSLFSAYKIKLLLPGLYYWWGKYDYQKISEKAFGDSQNRPMARLFFRLFEKRQEASAEEREKYLQLKYFHSAKPWEALNLLAEDYGRRGYDASAQMCYAESLLLNPKQDDIFEYVKALKYFEYKKAKLSEDQCAISVIVCTNRQPVELKTCLRSILNNTFQDFEIVVLNNGGPQEIQKVAESFSDSRIVYKRDDSVVGLPKARNAAVPLAKGRYIAYLDDDDVFYPDHLETLYNATENGKYRFVYAKTQGVLGYLQGDEFYQKANVFNWGAEFDREKFATQASLGNHAVLHAKSLFTDLGLFNDGLIVSEDEDFWLRCARAIDLKFVDKNTSEYRIKDNNSVVLNSVRNRFQGLIVRRFHGAFCGELALLKYFVHKRDKKRAQAVLQIIKAEYLQGYFKPPFALNELWPLVQYCGDKGFLRVVIADFFRLYRKECVQSLINRRAFLLLPMCSSKRF